MTALRSLRSRSISALRSRPARLPPTPLRASIAILRSHGRWPAAGPRSRREERAHLPFGARSPHDYSLGDRFPERAVGDGIDDDLHAYDGGDADKPGRMDAAGAALVGD